MTVFQSPEAGGATVWPYARISVFPEKGSAIYWRNTFTDNTSDVFTRHKACPVSDSIGFLFSLCFAILTKSLCIGSIRSEVDWEQMGGIQCPVEQTKLQDPARNTIRPCFELIRFLRTIGYQTRASTALIFFKKSNN